jgi:hypothetical protein
VRTLPLAALAVAALVAAVGAAAPAGAAADSRRAVEDGSTGPFTSTPAAPAGTASFGIRLLDIPIAEAEDPRARQYIVDNLTPGTVIHRRIEVSTTSLVPLHASVYSDAATITGGSFIGARGHTSNELATWTSVNEGSLQIPAGGAAVDTVTIAVPEDAAPGERYAVIWAEVDGTGPGDISLVNRAGIRVYLSVGGHNPPASNFTVDSLTARRDPRDRPLVQAMVHNTGGRALDLSGTLTLTEVHGGLTAGPYPIVLGTTLAPGQTEPVQSIATDQIPDGPWNATLDLKSGLLEESYQARISFPAGPGTSSPVPAHPTASGGHLRLITGGLLSSAALGAIAVPVARRRRNRSPHGR